MEQKLSLLEIKVRASNPLRVWSTRELDQVSLKENGIGVSDLDLSAKIPVKTSNFLFALCFIMHQLGFYAK